MIRRAAALALVAPLLLGGCVAAAIPVVAGGVLGKKGLDGEFRGGKGKDIGSTPTAGERVPVFAPPAKAAPAPTPSPTASAAPTPAPAASAAPAETKPVAGPAPPAESDGPYAAFARYAVAVAQAGVPAGSRSALIDQATIGSKPQLASCTGDPPAVVIDLDPGTASFDLADAPFPAPGLAQDLAAIRKAGVKVLWAAGLTADQAGRLTTILQASGLDPDKADGLLLLRKKGERKQERLMRAAGDWCVVAIAGDRRGDFDEMFDYLRDPEGPIAQALIPNIGVTWFLVPPPID